MYFFIPKGCEKLGISGYVKVVLEDGSEIDDDEVLEEQLTGTILIFESGNTEDVLESPPLKKIRQDKEGVPVDEHDKGEAWISQGLTKTTRDNANNQQDRVQPPAVSEGESSSATSISRPTASNPTGRYLKTFLKSGFEWIS